MTAYNKNIKNTPRIPASIVGEVTNNDDPDKKGRVKVYIPSIFEGSEENKFWVNPIMPMGSFIVPDVGEIVSVTFKEDKPSKGYYVGRIYKDSEIPLAYKDNTNNKIIYNFRNNNSLVIDDQESTCEINIKQTKIIIDGSGKISLFNGNPDVDDITLYSPNPLNIKSDKKLSLQGSEVEISERDDVLSTIANKKARISLKEGTAQIGVTGSTEAKLIDNSTNHLTISSDELVMQYNDTLKGNLNTIRIDHSSINMFNKLSYFVLNSKGVELNGNQTSRLWLNGIINIMGVTNMLSTAPASPIAFVPSVPMVLNPPTVQEGIKSVTRMTGENMECDSTVELLDGYVEDFKKKEGLNMTSSVDIAKEIAGIVL